MALDINANNKRIAKNSIMLYFRMFLTMGVSLFTSRIILKSLGIEDHGIYNVVAGFVSMFTFINSAMTSATQRYITFALGNNDSKHLNEVFCTCMNIHILISFGLLIIGETIGLWFLNSRMIIPDSRLIAANIVYQLAILSTIILIVSVPYNALIVAHERMSTFAYISILDVSAKLLVAYLIFISPIDKLIAYSVLMFAVQFVIRQIYQIYCRRHFKESHFHLVKNKSLSKEMISFSVWSLYGNLASVFSGQGVNVVLNLFHGPAVNSARALSIQVQNAVLGFSSNFQMAINPQITKNYAAGNISYMHSLIYASSKYSFFFLYLVSLPLFLEAENVLSVWLEEVPAHTANFLRLTLISTLVNAQGGPLSIAAQATGDIKKYQTIVGGILLLTLPIAYLGLRVFTMPEIVYVTELMIVVIAQLSRVFFMKSMIELSISEYIKKVASPIVLVFFSSSILPILTYYILPKQTLSSFIIVTVTCISSVLLASWFLGIDNTERVVVKTYVKQLFSGND